MLLLRKKRRNAPTHSIQQPRPFVRTRTGGGECRFGFNIAWCGKNVNFGRERAANCTKTTYENRHNVKN